MRLFMPMTSASPSMPANSRSVWGIITLPEALGDTSTAVLKEVENVMKGGAAENAGLQKGDIITQLGDSEISNYSDLKNAIKQFSAGDTAQLTFYRAGESQTVSVTFDEAVPEGVNN